MRNRPGDWRIGPVAAEEPARAPGMPYAHRAARLLAVGHVLLLRSPRLGDLLGEAGRLAY